MKKKTPDYQYEAVGNITSLLSPDGTFCCRLRTHGVGVSDAIVLLFLPQNLIKFMSTLTNVLIEEGADASASQSSTKQATRAQGKPSAQKQAQKRLSQQWSEEMHILDIFVEWDCFQ